MADEAAEQRIAIGLAGPDPLALARELLARDLWPGGPGAVPAKLRVDQEKKPATGDWLTTWAPRAERALSAYFRESPDEYLLVRPGLATLARFRFPADPERVLDLLAGLPFTVASFETLYDEWEERDPPYRAPGFADGHFRHGWACAFKGKGRERLVTDRWLDHAGPWRLWRGGSGDTVLVQFHGLGADAATALGQAEPGHRRMGIADEGGYLQTGYVYDHPVKGLYDAAQRTLKVIVHGRDVTRREMLDAAAAQRYQALGAGRPLDRIRYVFLEPERARAHLHELWLHGLEVWTIELGNEVRLDAAYTPAPESRPVVPW